MKTTNKDLPFGIAFGSNIGNRLENLSKAKELLLAKSSNPSSCIFSSIYESAPVNCSEPCGPFLNATAEMHFDISPERLLCICLDIELNFGRPKIRKKNEPRIIDLDILYAGNLILKTNHLKTPHPEILNRRFVLEPLAEIRPNFILPNQVKSIMEHLSSLKSTEPPLKLIQSNW